MNAKYFSQRTALERLQKEAKDLEKQKKNYKVKSEYYRLMYSLMLQIETMEKTMSL